MAKKKKAKIPSTLEILLSIRNQVETPKGGPHVDKSKYDRNQEKKLFRKEEF